MSERSNYVALLFAFLLSSSESETANITTLISKSPSPSYAVEGKNFTFVWTYSLDGTIGSAQYTIERDSGRDVLIGRRFSPGTVTVEAGFEARFRAQATETRAELTILAVQRSDQQKYKLTVLPTGAGSIIEPLLLVVNFPANITEISANQSVIEGGNITLRCLADGKPTPNITWTRHPDDCVVDMTLTDIRRKHAGKYRCTAYNGIGRPTSEDVVVDVQYPTEATGFGENATVAQGGNKTLSCPVDGNPKPNITWYRGSEISETLIFIGEKWIARDIGCYTCVASNSLGTAISITQCLAFEESSTPSTAPTPSTVPTSAPKGPSRIVIGVVIVVAVFVVIVIGLVAWWMWKKGKCRKHTKNGERHYVEVAK